MKAECLCCKHKVPTERPRRFPLCNHEFKGNGWDGVDAHWRARHDKTLKYEDFWASLCEKHRG